MTFFEHSTKGGVGPDATPLWPVISFSEILIRIFKFIPVLKNGLKWLNKNKNGCSCGNISFCSEMSWRFFSASAFGTWKLRCKLAIFRSGRWKIVLKIRPNDSSSQWSDSVKKLAENLKNDRFRHQKLGHKKPQHPPKLWFWLLFRGFKLNPR